MRRLLWFTLGFVIACGLGVYMGVGLWLAGVSALLSVLLFIFRKPALNILATIALGVVIGTVWNCCYSQIYLKPLSQFDGEKVQTEAVISDYSFRTNYGIAAEAKIYLNEKPYSTQIYLPIDCDLEPGDEISGTFRLRMTTQNAKQSATYHQGKGIFVLAYGDEDVTIDEAEDTDSRYLPTVLRKKILEMLSQIFSGDVLAFAQALLLGDDSLLSYELDTAFKISGIRHVIAVSGLHVSILFGLIYFLSGKRRVLTAVLGIPFLLLFASIVGFTPSVVRASVMQGLMILALLFKKEYDPPTSLAFAVLIMLIANPLTITSVSFQLSVCCIIGILLFYKTLYQFFLQKLGQPKGRKIGARIIRGMCASVAISLSTLVVTTPLSAIYFGTVSLIGILTNLLVIWAIPFVFYAIMGCCILGIFYMPGAIFLGKVFAVPIWCILSIARILSKPHFAALYTCNGFVVLFLVFVYLLLIVFLLSQKRKPLVFAGCVATGLAITILFSWVQPQMDDYRVTVLDVGQGQAVLFQSEQKNYLVDCGGDYGEMAADTVAEELLSQGITALDGIILTHYDTDHAGGVLPLMSRIHVKQLYLPNIQDSGELKSIFASEHKNIVSWITKKTQIQNGSMQFTLFPGDPEADDNESCMCVLFQRENCAILLTGDRNSAGEQKLLEGAELPKLDVLLVGHHGSASATGLALLRATKPDVAVISVGADNSYGHPTADVLYRLNLFCCRILRTDQDGTIIFRG